MKRVVTFGETMLRLQPPGFERVRTTRSFEALYAGSEANVAVSLAVFDVPAVYVTRLPNNDLGDGCMAYLRQFGVITDYILRGGDRQGIYFIERGAAQRASKIIYDRANSSFATIQPGMVDWVTVFDGADWFHWTGITPAVSSSAAAACLEAVQNARALGLTISTDLNYRKNLWKWGKMAGEVMADLLQYCDLVIANEEDADKVFGIQAVGVDVTGGKVEATGYRQVAEKLAERFPSVRTVAFTLRSSISATHNTWSGVLWQDGEIVTAPMYDIDYIVDRVGGGDAFGGGLIFALRQGRSLQQALGFAVAAACLKHSIPGDFNAVSLEEVEKLISGDASGRVQR
jgi:2-dehydro-3-deoxygluconokinase